MNKTLATCSNCGRKRELNEDGLCFDCLLDKVLGSPLKPCVKEKTGSLSLVRRSFIEHVFGKVVAGKLKALIRKFSEFMKAHVRAQ